MKETVTEKAERLIRISNAIEAASLRRQEERRTLNLLDGDDESCVANREESSFTSRCNSKQSSCNEESSHRMLQNARRRSQLSKAVEQWSEVTSSKSPSRSSHGDCHDSSMSLTDVFGIDRASQHQKTKVPQNLDKTLLRGDRHHVSVVAKEQQNKNALRVFFARATATFDAEDASEQQTFWDKKRYGGRSSDASVGSSMSLEASSKAEVVQKCRDVQNALVSMRENATLKYQKLEIEHAQLKVKHSVSINKLEAAQAKLEDMEKTNRTLRGHLIKEASWQESCKYPQAPRQ